MPPPDPVIDQILDRLDAVDPDAAADAALALRWLLGERDLGHLSQADLQQFLWYELPFKWLTDAAGHLRTADALGRFFELAGMPRYAALCRSPETTAIIRIYETGGADVGFRAFLAAGRRSGVLPDDVDGFAWSDYVGPVELDALRSTAMALELAVRSGELVPGRRGWRRRQHEIIRAHLERPRAEHFGESWLQAIITERLSRWQDDGRSLARAQLIGPVANQLLHPVGLPRRSPAGRRLRWLLAEADRPAGMGLNGRGEPGPAVADRYRAEFAWWDDGTAVPLDLRLLHRFARRAGLITRRNQAARLTPAGRSAASDHQLLWATVAAVLAGHDQHGRPRPRAGDLPPPDLSEVALAVLLDGRRVSWELLVRSLHVVVTELGWGGADGRPPRRDAVEEPLFELAVLMEALGLLRFHGHTGGDVELTATGRLTARRALRVRALSPTRRLPPRS